MTANINFDQNELDKFARLACHWWDPAGDLRTLHQINPLRLQYITDRVNLKNKKVLDVGCGGGILSESLAQAQAQVTGIDLNAELITVAELHQLESKTNVQYTQTDIESFAAKHPASYDVITCLELLEHVPDPQSVITACAQLLKPGGHLFFSTINRNPKAYLFAIIGAEYVLKLLPKNTHDYAKFIRPSELANMMNVAKLQSLETMGIVYHPLTKTFNLSANDISVNYLMYGCK